MASLDELSVDQLQALKMQLGGAVKPQESSIDDLPVEKLQSLREHLLTSKVPIGEKSFEKQAPMQSARIGLETGTTFGARPAIAGAAGGLAGLIETLKQGKYGSFPQAKESIGNALSTGADFYGQARDAALEEQRVAAETNPKANFVGNLAGGVLTAPLIAAKGIQGASALGKVGSAIGQGAKLGLATGTGQAIGEARGLGLEDAKQAAGTIGLNTVVGGATGGITQGFAEGAKALANTSAGKSVGGAIKSVAKAPLNLVKKVTSALSGINENDIATYAAKTDEVNKIIKSSGGNISEAADKLREGIQNQIRAKRQSLSNEITQALSELPNDVQVNGIPVLQKLREIQARINPDLYPEKIKAIDGIIAKVRTQGETGLMSPRQLFDVKEFLQEMASPAYMKDGQIFQNPKEVLQAAKQAAALARKELNSFLGEGSAIPKANKMLSELHVLESRLNKNLIKSGGSESALLAAARNPSNRNAKNLQKLAEITGQDILGKAQELSAAQSFAGPSIFSGYQTGKSILGSSLGASTGGYLGGDAESAGYGGMIGAALGSPVALKTAIQTGNIPRSLLRSLIGSKQLQSKIPAIDRIAEGAKQVTISNKANAIERRLKAR